MLFRTIDNCLSSNQPLLCLITSAIAIEMKRYYSLVALSLLLLLGGATRTSAFTPRTKVRSTKLGATTSSGSEGEKIVDDLLRSRDFATVFNYLRRNPKVAPTGGQAVELLNSFDQSSIATTESIDNLFARLAKQGSLIKSFGCMVDDGPIMDLELARVEQMYLTDPLYVTSNLGVEQSMLDSLKIPGLTSPAMSAELKRAEEVKSVGVIAVAVTAQLVAVVAQAPSPTMTVESLMPFLSTIAALGGLMSFDNTIGNYGLTRQLQWLREMVKPFINARYADESSRAAAATFIVAYLLGAPIRSVKWAPNELDTQLRFVFAEAPRIEMSDPTISDLRRGRRVTMQGLKRTATIQMASLAMQAVDGGRVLPMTAYQKMLFADLGQHASNIHSSDIADREFPQRLLPSLSLFGWLQGVLILREVGCGAVDAVAWVIRSGGGVGDACQALEASFDPSSADAPVRIRKQSRLREQAQVDEVVTLSSQISAIAESRALQASMTEALVLDSPIEQIPGAPRLKVEEFLLGPYPWASEVAAVARDLMNMKVKRDLETHSRVEKATQEELRDLAARLAPALAHKRTLEAAEDAAAPAGSAISSHAEAVQALKVAMAEQGLHDDAVPSLLTELDVLDQLIMDLVHIRKVHLEPLSQIAVSVSEQLTALFKYLSGDHKASSLVRGWDSEQQRTGIARTPEQENEQQGRGKSKVVTMEQLYRFKALLREARGKDRGGTASGDLQRSEGKVARDELLHGRGAAHDALELRALRYAERVQEVEEKLDSLHHAGRGK